jgi:predicted TIM-barrel fold metal-dependent hydrolase
VRIIDTHQHLLHPDRFRYEWTRDLPVLAGKPFGLEEYRKAAEGTGITQTLFMEVDVHETEARPETQFFLELAGKKDSGVIGVIATSRPESESFPAYLESVLHPKLKGIRRILHTEPDDLCQSAQFRANIGRLARLKLTFDLCMLPRQLPFGAELVRRNPNVQFVLDHCGIPNIKENELDPWRERICELSKLPNLACKVSGVVAYCHPQHIDAQHIRPFVEHCVDCFGWDRVLFGGDWPVCTLTSSLQRWVQIAKELVASESPQTQAKFFAGNAERIYQLTESTG